MTRRMPPDPARHFATPETEDPMEPTAFLVEGRDATRLAGYRWPAGDPVRGVIVLDHSERVAGAVLSGSAALDEVAALLDPSVEFDLTMLNVPFEPARTNFDWLSRDPAQVDAYIADARCGFGLDPAGFGSLREAA